MKITETMTYVGVNDHALDLFESQYTVPNGMAYNSYVIEDEHAAVIDSVEARFCEQWLNNIRAALGDKPVDYLIVLHMEPDHSANIAAFMQAYPNASVVATQKAFSMMNQFFDTDYAGRCIVAEEGGRLSLGEHNLTFFTAPMVHWPEVMMVFDARDQVLFSADAFGKFGALDIQEDWVDEARRYYFGIVGKFGAAVQTVFRKLLGLRIRVICPLHGPVLRDNIEYCMGKYQIWSTYAVEDEGIVIACASIYGNTMNAAQLLREKLLAYGCPKVTLIDLVRDDWTEAVEAAFRYGTLVLAASSYNGGVFPAMRQFIDHLMDRNYQNRKIAFMENGTWAPTATKTMMRLLEGGKNLSFAKNAVRILSVPNAQSLAALEALAKELCGDGREEA